MFSRGWGRPRASDFDSGLFALILEVSRNNSLALGMDPDSLGCGDKPRWLGEDKPPRGDILLSMSLCLVAFQSFGWASSAGLG